MRNRRVSGPHRSSIAPRTLDLRVASAAMAVRRRAARRDRRAISRPSRRKRPQLWNGRILLGCNPVFAAGRLQRRLFSRPISPASWPGGTGAFPDRSVFNGFGMGALRSRDGAFVARVRWASTPRTPVAIYFPSGTPDRDDVRRYRLDIERQQHRPRGRGRNRPHRRRLPGAEVHWDCVCTDVADRDG